MTRAPGPILAVRDLHVRLAGAAGTVVHAVRGVSYEVERGEVLGIVGESGSGKSVSALALLGLIPPHTSDVTGQVIFEGEDLLRMPRSHLRNVRGSRIAMVFQDPLASLNPVLTIERQISETITAHRGCSAQAARGRAAELLELVGIPDARRRARDYPHQFSGGMRQRAMIAMALACDPLLVIADEPTTALDVTVQAQVLELLRRIREELGTAIIVITHDLGVVAGFTDRLAVMYAGRLVEVGPTGTVLAQPSHHYTAGLLRALPRLDRPRQAALHPIDGAPPDLSTLIPGCAFSPRCAARLPQCRSEAPTLSPADRTPSHALRLGPHLSACHNPLGEPNPDRGTPVGIEVLECGAS